MEKGFWANKKSTRTTYKEAGGPIMALAPMADVTDAAFRRIIAKYGGPDIMWTEQVSCDGLCSVGKPKLLPILQYSEAERPIIAQLFGSNPENFYKCAELIQELDFDGIDINMGCPDRSINKQGAGAYLINEPELAKKIIKETKRGAGKLPVSVKTRVGYNKENLDEWLRHLLSAEPVAITIHARTRKELSLVPARWELVARAVELAQGSDTLILGNGDVKDIRDAYHKINESGSDGAMIGRAVFGNPWLFSGRNKADISLHEVLVVMLEHSKLYDELFVGVKSFALMRKHFGSYVGGFPGAKELRTKLMETNNSSEVEEAVLPYIS